MALRILVIADCKLSVLLLQPAASLTESGTLVLQTSASAARVGDDIMVVVPRILKIAMAMVLKYFFISSLL